MEGIEEPRSVLKVGDESVKAKFKAKPSKPFYLRAVRDVSLIEESDAVQVHFEDVTDLRSFSVRLDGGAWEIAFLLTALYPVKAPRVRLIGPLKTSLVQGRTRMLSFDGKKHALTNDELVGRGWRPIHGVHFLVKLIASELLKQAVTEEPAPQMVPVVWNELFLGGMASHQDQACVFAHTGQLSSDCVLLIVCEAFCSDLNARLGTETNIRGRRVFEALKSSITEPECDMVAAVNAAQFDQGPLGVSVCVAMVSSTHIQCVNVGNVACWTLQTGSRQAQCLSEMHDGLNASELERMGPNVSVVKAEATVRYIEGKTLVTRCLGLTTDCASFISSDPHVVSIECEPDDRVLIVGTRAMFDAVLPLELSAVFGPRVSAKEMCLEAIRIAQHRDAPALAFAMTCL